MLLWTIQISLISLILIFLIHNVIQFLKKTLTVPKIKDLVHSPLQKYENIIRNMSSKPVEIVDPDAMKNELKNFLKDQLKNNSEENSTDISLLQPTF
jgi:uncharacterized protein YeeX (DUF496 family)